MIVCRFIFPVVNLPTHPSTIDGEDYSVYVIGRRRGQIDDGAFHVFRISPSSCGYATQDLFGTHRIGPKGFCVIRFDVPRGNGVDVDAFACPFVGQGHGQSGNASFTCSVAGYGDASLKAEEGCGEHDFAMPPRDHVFAKLSRQ